MNARQQFVAAYPSIGFPYALHAWPPGDSAHRGFFYEPGQGRVRPAVMFSSAGKIVGAALVVAVVALIALSWESVR